MYYIILFTVGISNFHIFIKLNSVNHSKKYFLSVKAVG